MMDVVLHYMFVILANVVGWFMFVGLLVFIVMVIKLLWYIAKGGSLPKPPGLWMAECVVVVLRDCDEWLQGGLELVA